VRYSAKPIFIILL